MWVSIFSVSSVKYTLFLPYFNETNPLDGFSKKKTSNLQENPSSVSRVVSRGQADRHDEANSCFSEFCEGA